MMHDTQTLSEFLLARIAEDEALVLRQDPEYDNLAPQNLQSRWLAECEAKRRIVKGAYLIGGPESDSALNHEVTVAILAQPYAEHPDYRQEWKP